VYCLMITGGGLGAKPGMPTVSYHPRAIVLDNRTPRVTLPEIDVTVIPDPGLQPPPPGQGPPVSST
jgi:hypothetical protein